MLEVEISGGCESCLFKTAVVAFRSLALKIEVFVFWLFFFCLFSLFFCLVAYKVSCSCFVVVLVVAVISQGCSFSLVASWFPLFLSARLLGLLVRAFSVLLRLLKSLSQ